MRGHSGEKIKTFNENMNTSFYIVTKHLLLYTRNEILLMLYFLACIKEPAKGGETFLWSVVGVPLPTPPLLSPYSKENFQDSYQKKIKGKG